MGLEILIALFENLRLLAGVITLVGGAVLFIGGIVCVAEGVDKDMWRLYRKCVVGVIFASLIAVLPGVDDLWKVRIGLIKLQLSSPENIQKGADVIERLGKKLECKYLGCTENKD